MPLNLLKKYPDLLEIMHLSHSQKIKSLRGIFNRDIEDNRNFKYRGNPIFPVKKDGQPTMDTLFNHLTTKTENKTTKARSFDNDRACRLHWIKHHIDGLSNITIFSYADRINGRDVIRTYLFNEVEKYVIILEPNRNSIDYYYFISAYYLNEKQGQKQIKSKLKRKLDEIH